MKKLWSEFSKGFITMNPLFVLVLGNCPALILTIGLDGSIGMGLSLAFVMLFSSIFIAAIRNFIPNVVRIPIMIVIAATFVTIVDMTLHSYLPPIYALLGIYLPLITVN